MIELAFDVKSLVKWARLLDDVPKVTNRNIAAALNVAGTNVVRQLLTTLSTSTGLDQEVLRKMIKVLPATERRTEWSVDISKVWEPTGAKRSFPTREVPDAARDQVEEEQLVSVVTMHDERVCPICDEIRADGPYTPQEVENLSARLNRYGGGLFHPHCRCGTIPFNPSRRFMLNPRADNFGGEPVKKHMTVKQIAALVQKNMKVTLTGRK